MAFLCPSQLTVKKKVLRGKSPIPPDSYVVNGRTDNSTPTEYKSALKSPTSSTDSSNKTSNQQRTVRIKETTTLKHETLVERKIKAASPTKPANIRVKVTHDFKSEDDEELTVHKGHYVNIIYQKHDWVYVKDSAGHQGFIPYVYCSTVNVSTDSKSSTSGYEESFEESDDVEHSGVDRNINKRGKKSSKHQHHQSRTSGKTTPTTYFPKRPYGPQMTVLYDYKARYENDLRVLRGESVMLLNDQDPEWLWVATEDGEEGFIPRTFVISHTCEGCRKKILHEQVYSPCTNGDINTSDVTVTSSSSIDKKSKESSFTDPTSSSSSNDKKYSLKGSKLIALYDFEGTAFDDLTVVAGEYVYANLKDQIVPHWIWAYSPYRKRSGFIPEEYLKEPVISDI